MLNVLNLHKYYGDHHVLKGINLEVHAQEVLAIVGSKNSGKSTLLRCLSYLENIDEGEILLNGMKEAKNDIGYVSNNFHLFPHKTVLEHVIERPVIFHKQTKEKATSDGINLLKKFHLQNKAHIYPKNLSVSEKQMVVIIRQLAMKPKVMMFDEPTTMLHSKAADEVFQMIKVIAQEGMTMMIVTKDIDFILDVADWIIVLEKGNVIEKSTPESFLANRRNIERFFHDL